MKIDRRLTLLGVMLIVLSMTMATQYATTRIGYRYKVVHPSESDIRFIGSDNSSGGGRILRVEGNASGSRSITLELGNFSPAMNKTYTAAFGIVNEEYVKINITHANISGNSDSHLDVSVLLHGNRDAKAGSEAASNVCTLIRDGVSQTDSSTIAWVLGAGNGDPSDSDVGNTIWDQTQNVRYSTSDTDATNETDDIVWVQIEIDLEQADSDISNGWGQIWIHFMSGTLA